MVIKPIQALTSELTKEIMKKIGYQKMAEEYKKFVPKSELYKKLIIEDFTTGRPIVEIAKEVWLDQSSIRKALRKRWYNPNAKK